MKLPFLLLALLIIFAGCCELTEELGLGEENATVEEAPDYSYDILVNDIYSTPEYPRLSEEYKIHTSIQIYGRYLPEAYSLWILDGNRTIYQKTISNPELVEHFEFEYYAESTEPHHIRVEVQSLDAIHPEPETNLDNNILREDMHVYPLGYYDLNNWKITWFYDAVGMQLQQAQAFTLEHPLNISKIGVYIQAPVPPPPGSSLSISLHQKPTNYGNIGVGKRLLGGTIDATGIKQEPSWQYIEFEEVLLENDTYWIVLEYQSTSGAGLEWYRAQGNQYGPIDDTQMLDLAGDAVWEYKNFDFAFKVE